MLRVNPDEKRNGSFCCHLIYRQQEEFGNVNWIFPIAMSHICVIRHILLLRSPHFLFKGFSVQIRREIVD